MAIGDLEFLAVCPKLSSVSLSLDHIDISKDSSAVKADLCSELGNGEDPTSTPGWDQSGRAPVWCHGLSAVSAGHTPEARQLLSLHPEGIWCLCSTTVLQGYPNCGQKG